MNLYESFSLINRNFFIAHSNYVSLYDILEKKWKKHYYFENKVKKVFRNQKDDNSFNIGIYLSNQKV